MTRGDRRLRVCHVLPSVDDAHGGPGALLASVLELDDMAGVRSTVLAGVGREGELAARIASCADLHTYRPGALLGRLHASRSFLQAIWRAAGTHDVVVAHSVFNLPMVVAGAAALRRSRAWVIAPHGSLDPYDVRKHERLKRALGPLWKWLLGRGELWCITEVEEREVVTYGAQPGRHVVPPPAVPAPGMEREHADGVLAARSILLDGNGRVVTFIGRFDVKKGLPRLIEAFERAAGPDDVLVLAGSGTPAAEDVVRRRVGGSPLRDRILTPGWVTAEERAALLCRSDLFALASDDENFGMAVIEALAAGVPVVITDRVAVAGIVERYGCGLVSRADTDAYTDALLRGLTDGSLRSVAAARGQNLVETEFAAPQVAARYSELLDAAVSARPGTTALTLRPEKW